MSLVWFFAVVCCFSWFDNGGWVNWLFDLELSLLPWPYGVRHFVSFSSLEFCLSCYSMKEQAPIAGGSWNRKSFTELFTSNTTSTTVPSIMPPSSFKGEPAIPYTEDEIAALATPFHLCSLINFLMENRLLRYSARNFILWVSRDHSQLVGWILGMFLFVLFLKKIM